MKRNQTKDYLSPTVEIVRVEVEGGFAATGVGLETTPYDPEWPTI